MVRGGLKIKTSRYTSGTLSVHIPLYSTHPHIPVGTIKNPN